MSLENFFFKARESALALALIKSFFESKFSKLKHQVKSNRYYIFWAIATITVFIGQIYVGSGYRQMSEEIKTLNQTILNKLMEKESKFLPLLNQSRSF